MGIKIERVIPASREKVWSELADLASHATWMKDAVEVEFLGTARSGVGTRMRVPTKVGLFRTVDILEVTEWVEGQSMGVDHKGLVSGTGRFSLEGDDPTTVVWEETLRFPWWLGGPVVAFLARPILRWIWKGNLQRFSAGFGSRSPNHG
ncbi:MAG: SRPBCC family protein [Acidimicrobiia bacterium]